MLSPNQQFWLNWLDGRSLVPTSARRGPHGNGMRAGEVLGLQWGDIDWDRSCIHIRRSAWCGKTNSTKTRGSATDIPMPEKLADTLRTYGKIWRQNPAGFLFTTRNDNPRLIRREEGTHLITEFWDCADCSDDEDKCYPERERGIRAPVGR